MEWINTGQMKSCEKQVTFCCPELSQLYIYMCSTIIIIHSVKRLPLEEEPDFTDSTYQAQLPAHARSTASMVS